MAHIRTCAHMMDPNVNHHQEVTSHCNATQVQVYTSISSSTSNSDRELTGCNLHSRKGFTLHYCPSCTPLVFLLTLTHLSATKTASFITGTH